MTLPSVISSVGGPEKYRVCNGQKSIRQRDNAYNTKSGLLCIGYRKATVVELHFSTR